MTVVDPRIRELVVRPRRYAGWLLGGAGADAVLLCLQAWLLATLVSAGVRGRLDAVALGTLGAVVLARVVLTRATDRVVDRTSVATRTRLRARLARRIHTLGPEWTRARRTGSLATTLVRGIDSLDSYLTGYLPQLARAVLVPATVLVWLCVADPVSGVVLLVTVPLVPVFGVLVGRWSRARTGHQWRLLHALGGHFLDSLTGLSTVRMCGRVDAHSTGVRRTAERLRAATTDALRVAFVSAFVLETLATLSVALVAVPMGLRLLDGRIGLPTALLVLLLAPQVLLPLRAAGSGFHAGTESQAVLDEVTAVLGAQPPVAGGALGVDRERRPELRLSGVTVHRPGAGRPALSDVDLVVAPGERVALVGPSGGGKTTLLAVLLGFVPLARGSARWDGTELSALDLASLRGAIAWVGQHPHLFDASVADNVRLGHPDATLDQVRAACELAEADGFVSGLPRGYDTVLGDGGRILSAGQRQRIALARAFLRDAPVVLLDEPTARLDRDSEAALAVAIDRLTRGRTALVVAHRPAVVALADRVVELVDGRIGTGPDSVRSPVAAGAGSAGPAPARLPGPAGAGLRAGGLRP